jgi:hypothetical protein
MVVVKSSSKQVEDEVNDADDDALIIEQLEGSRRVRTKLATSEDAALEQIFMRSILA